MNFPAGNSLTKALVLVLSPVAIWFLCQGSTLVMAQSDPSPTASADHTITLTKVIEVYEFEDMKVAVDQYAVTKGDSLAKIMKKRGLLSGRRDEAKLLRLVKDLNPNVSDFNNIVPGQVLNLPSILDDDAKIALEEGKAPDDQIILEISNLPATVTETVKVYDRPQGTQQAARVVVMRHVPGAQTTPDKTFTSADAVNPTEAPVDPAPMAASAAETSTSPAETAASEIPVTTSETATEADSPAAASVASTPADGTVPAGAVDLSFPSGNAGALTMEPVTKVVYRTVRIRPGDSLERLLRREGMHKDLIYNHLLKVTMDLNPEIKHPDLIQAGAELRIPAAGNYLTALAGVNPDEVKSAAAAIAQRRSPQGGGAGATAAAIQQLPNAAAESAKNSLGLIFTRLGEKMDQTGLMPVTSGKRTFEVDKAAFPMVELAGGRKLLLDTGSNLPNSAVRALKAQKPPIKVFRQGRKENLDRALGRLWPLCGYYRVYTKDRTYEGGGDIRLRLAADWIVWPTQEAWNTGQPLVINRAARDDSRTDAVWVHFLEDHGIQMVDIYRNVILPVPKKSDAPPAELKVTPLNDRNPTLFAAELVNSFGIEPKVGVQLDLSRSASGEVARNLTAPILWETEKSKVVLEFGEMPADVVATLRQNGYKVVTTRSESPDVVTAVVDGLGFKVKENLVINAPAGGPKMSMIIKGLVVTASDGEYLITKATLPPGLAGFLDPKLKILKY